MKGHIRKRSPAGSFPSHPGMQVTRGPLVFKLDLLEESHEQARTRRWWNRPASRGFL
jgi:hypothetical protein